ncbi:MAG: hypothetical protein KJN93_04405, partial [Alphaproteobacteria bacterium]|nr:hypothetical protein [Alphaproteobacteria bacterium]
CNCRNYASLPAMDMIALTFYAAVCGILSLFAPRLGGMVTRLFVGAGVGVVAASVLPVVRAVTGAY